MSMSSLRDDSTNGDHVTTIGTRGFELAPWQQRAVEAWLRGVGGTPCKGTLEVVTGGGKTLIALACAAEVSRHDPGLKLAIVVPTEALARQWRDSLIRYTNIPAEEIGLLGAGGQDTLDRHRVLVAVLNTAAKRLPDMPGTGASRMLIVDECHRAGAPTFSRVLSTPSRYRLGLSATPDREELDDDGEPLRFDEQVVGRELGSVVHRFSLKDARKAGWLPEFSLHHHGVTLSPEERSKYEAISRQVDDAADELASMSIETARARQVSGRPDEAGAVARRWVQLTSKRKDLLYRARERHRVTAEVIARTVAANGTTRALLFHERVDEAVELFAKLSEALNGAAVALEHSRLGTRQREESLRAFAAGDAQILVSVKSLTEGINVPEADTGVSVASTSSVRQRVQALGRVLRRAVTDSGEAKIATMHLLYVRDSVDELIYEKADWADLTGENANHYWVWRFGEARPERASEPPRSPKPTEDQAWRLLGMPDAGFPYEWPGVVTGQEYSLDTAGVVHNAFGKLISNPQAASELVQRVRGRQGGKFVVTPEHRLVLVRTAEADSRVFLTGRLQDTFTVAEEVTDHVEGTVETEALQPGDVYDGPSDKDGGSLRLSQRAGGSVERAVKRGREVAARGTETEGERNADRILEAWNRLNRPIHKFFVNSLGHAWYEAKDGSRRYLATVTGGFEWPK
jgi:superfamily II DNA or RNA helicase